MNENIRNNECILGVDTHLDIHVGAIINHSGKVAGTKSVSSNHTGFKELLDWASTFGTVSKAGVEGTGTYGAGLCDYLQDQNIQVFEVNRPDRTKRRLEGKTDPIDAISAARSVWSGVSTAIPKTHSGICEALRIISVARKSAVKSKTQTINQIRALLVSSPQKIRDKLWQVKPHKCVEECLKCRDTKTNSTAVSILVKVLKSLAKRWLLLKQEVDSLDKELDILTLEHTPNLRSRLGVGPQTAATLASVAGDNPERLKSEASLAALCGVNPLPASSGKTIRHRLNRGGNRTANNAIWTIAMVRMRSENRTKAYVDRRTAEGLSQKEICRCLKRYIVRELYPVILNDLSKIKLVT